MKGRDFEIFQDIMAEYASIRAPGRRTVAVTFGYFAGVVSPAEGRFFSYIAGLNGEQLQTLTKRFPRYLPSVETALENHRAGTPFRPVWQEN